MPRLTQPGHRGRLEGETGLPERVCVGEVKSSGGVDLLRLSDEHRDRGQLRWGLARWFLWVRLGNNTGQLAQSREKAVQIITGAVEAQQDRYM